MYILTGNFTHCYFQIWTTILTPKLCEKAVPDTGSQAWLKIFEDDFYEKNFIISVKFITDRKEIKPKFGLSNKYKLNQKHD